MYAKYPTTALPSIIAEIPAPMGALFQLSWDLHNTQTDDFDQAAALHLLQTAELIEYSGELNSPRPLNADPLEALHTVVHLYTEVLDAAQLYGQCMADGISKFLDPTVYTPPAVLSDTEHMRIACALWVMKIFRQLLLKLTLGESAQTYLPHLTDAFVANLQPWQIDQVLSLERKLQPSDDTHHHSLEYTDHVDSRLAERLMSSSYVESYLIAFHRRNARFHRDLVRSIHHHRQTNAPVPAAQTSLSRPVTRHKTISIHLGLSFFDASRLAQWRIHSAADMLTYTDDAYQRKLACLTACETPLLHHTRWEEAQIIEWTRWPGNLTLQEWQNGESVENVM
ncbi:hypothetical protein B5807_05260 [Epicoccum nigrum]|uniref:Uncharacterized protein n=1 Tax=Epicoccum nigrum TaxID=105696 RepID=A0A1Y2M1Y4_EPING|nr:hypothetical protein B5807_05260 [Epicoccum nigrum]